MERGKKNGPGRYFYNATKDVYNGEWCDDNRHGKGTYDFGNGDAYEGSFANGQLDRPGSYKRTLGELLNGSWRKNSRHGAGKLTDKDETAWKIEFNNDAVNNSKKIITSLKYDVGLIV